MQLDMHYYGTYAMVRASDLKKIIKYEKNNFDEMLSVKIIYLEKKNNKL